MSRCRAQGWARAMLLVMVLVLIVVAVNKVVD